jgi:G3E family GTPase
MKDDDQRFMVQAVHMLLEGGSQRLWKSDERRDSLLVFIGRGLPKERLKEEFEPAASDLRHISNPSGLI